MRAVIEGLQALRGIALIAAVTIVAEAGAWPSGRRVSRQVQVGSCS
jgi:hypothetical protein